MLTSVTSTETVRLIRDGENGVEWGKGVWRLWKREIIYLSLQCHHQNDSCSKVGGDESHFKNNVRTGKSLVLCRAHLCRRVCLKWREGMHASGWGGGGGHLF